MDCPTKIVSMLGLRSYFSNNGTYTFRLQVGDVGNWDADPPLYTVIGLQDHDPFPKAQQTVQTTLFSQEQAYGMWYFAGLHNQHGILGCLCEGHEQSTGDSDSCWGLQVVPLEQFGSDVIFPGYLDSFSAGTSTHLWQSLWVR